MMGFFSSLKKKKLMTLGVAMMIGAGMLAGCGGSKGDSKAPEAVKASKPLFIGLSNAPTGFNPLLLSDTGGRFVSRFLYDTLLGQPSVNEFTPHLANSIETVDKQTYTIKLNPNAKWSDGKPITAEDVVFTFNTIANPKVESSRGRYIKMLEGLNGNGKLLSGTEIPNLVAKDATTVEFKCKTPLDPNYVKGLLGFDVPIIPKHIFGAMEPESISKSSLATNPVVVSGPYKFVK